jgi:hypothetical protein
LRKRKISRRVRSSQRCAARIGLPAGAARPIGNLVRRQGSPAPGPVPNLLPKTAGPCYVVGGDWRPWFLADWLVRTSHPSRAHFSNPRRAPMIDKEERSTKDTEEFVRPGRRASRFYESEPRVRVRLEVAGRSHPGNVRENNEDNYIAVRRYRGREVLLTSVPDLFEPTEDDAYALAVADGMGGCNFGELASLIAMRTGWELGAS